MVTMFALITLSTLQPAGAETVRVPVCTLTTPRGDDVRFFLWGDPTPTNIRLSALPGSAWPAGTVVGARPSGETGTRFNLGGLNGLRLELSGQGQGRTQRAATLFMRENERATLPIAYGFCQDEQVTADPPDPLADRNLIGIDHAAFDPEQWPNGDCALLLSNGRRIRIDPELQQNDSLRMTSADLWSGRPVTVRVRHSNMNGRSVGSFGQAGTPQGVRLLFVEQPRATVLVRFQDLNDPALSGTTGYAICGVRRVVRRPNRSESE